MSTSWHIQTREDLREMLAVIARSCREALASDDPREWSEALGLIADDAEKTLSKRRTRIVRPEPILWACCGVPKSVGHATKCAARSTAQVPA